MHPIQVDEFSIKITRVTESISGSCVPLANGSYSAPSVVFHLVDVSRALPQGTGGSHTCQERHIFSNDGSTTKFPPNLRCVNIVKSADTYFLPNFRRANISTPVLQSQIKRKSPLRFTCIFTDNLFVISVHDFGPVIGIF